MSSSRTISSSARSYSGGRGAGMGGSLSFGSSSFGSTSRLRTSSSATLHSSGGDISRSSGSSFRGSRSKYSQSPVSSVGSVGSLQVPALAFSRSVNSLSSMQSNSAYSARSARHGFNLNSTSRVGGFSSGRAVSSSQGIVSDGYNVATMTRNNDMSRRSSSNVDAAWRNAFIAERGYTPTEAELQAYIAFNQSQGIFSPPFSTPQDQTPTPDPFASGLGNMYDSWYNQFISEFGHTPSASELQDYINWQLGSGSYYNPNPQDQTTPTDPFASGLGSLYDSWYNQFVSEMGRTPSSDQELQDYINWKLGTGTFFNPNPENPPSTPDPFASGLGNLGDSWYYQFVSEMGRPPSSPEELQAFINWKLTGLYYQTNVPIGDGVWLLLIFAVAMLVRRMAKKKQLVIENKSLT